MTEMKRSLLSNFDIAFKVDWTNPRHKFLHECWASIFMYESTKGTFHIVEDDGTNVGSFAAVRFNRQYGDGAESRLKRTELLRSLFKNESPATFTEETVGGCLVLEI